MRYNPALDGVRALAVAAVIAYHCSRQALPGGFVGVDIFFVLSGYLITSLLFQEADDSGAINLLRFYWRRALRLWPPLIAMLLAYVALSPIFFIDAAAPLEALIAGLYLSDYAKAFWQVPTNISHTWSLAVEEHFYLVWPLVILALARFCRKQAFPILIAAFVAASLWRMIDLAWGADFFRTYYRFDTRMSGLVLGAALAVMPWKPGARTGNALALFATLTLGWAFISLQWNTPAPLLLAGVVVDIGAACLVLSATAGNNSHMVSMLSRPPLIYVGKISYSLYLWHYLVVRALRDSTDAWLIAVAVVVIGGTMAALSYEFIEKPLKALRHARAQAA